MISKDKFVEIISILKKESDYIDNINKINIEYGKEEYIMFPTSFDIALDLLAEQLELKNKDIFYWWIFDENFGRDFITGDVKDNDKEVNLSTTELFYEYLKGENK